MTENAPLDINEIRQSVRLLAEFVSNEDAQPTDATIAALQMYASACRLVNDLLGECHRLIRLGQRSEALRQVEIMKPNPLEIYDTLQFKNVKWLFDVCQDCKLAPPPVLDAQAAAKLNEAFALEKTHADILRQHRLLALSRAPLRRRLEVLRLISKAAPTEIFWQDDITEYELKRVEEIRAVMAVPKAQEDWVNMRDIYQEVTAVEGWSRPFPLDLAEQIKKARNRLLGTAARSELSAPGAQMAKSYQILSEATQLLKQPRSFISGKDALVDIEEHQDAVEAAVNQAEAIRVKYDLPESSRLFAPFVDAAKCLKNARSLKQQWLDFEVAVRDLEKGLESGVDWYYVQLYYSVASAYHLPIPRSVLTKFQARAQSKFTKSIAVGAAVLFVVLIFIVIVIKLL